MSRYYILYFIFFIFAAAACHNDYAPKPRGYYRINLPDKKYQDYQSGCNYSFKIPTYAAVWNDSSEHTNACWKNVVFPSLNGRIHLSYYAVNSSKELIALMENARKLAFNSASQVQFYLTDSTKHFLRGALYFYAEPQADSLAPLIKFVKKDINVLLESLEWK